MCDCYKIGGPFIAEDPDCEIHGKDGLLAQLNDLKAENELLQKQKQIESKAAAYWMGEANKEHNENERLREEQELGFVAWDTIIKAIGDWGGPEHECFNKAIQFIKAAQDAAMKGGDAE